MGDTPADAAERLDALRARAAALGMHRYERMEEHVLLSYVDDYVRAQKMAINDQDPITMDPLKWPWFELPVNTSPNAAGSAHAFDARALAKYFCAKRTFQNPLTRQELDRHDVERLDQLLQDIGYVDGTGGDSLNLLEIYDTRDQHDDDNDNDGGNMDQDTLRRNLYSLLYQAAFQEASRALTERYAAEQHVADQGQDRTVLDHHYVGMIGRRISDFLELGELSFAWSCVLTARLFVPSLIEVIGNYISRVSIEACLSVFIAQERIVSATLQERMNDYVEPHEPADYDANTSSAGAFVQAEVPYHDGMLRGYIEDTAFANILHAGATLILIRSLLRTLSRIRDSTAVDPHVMSHDNIMTILEGSVLLTEVSPANLPGLRLVA